MDSSNLSVVILSYNTKDITGRCLTYLKSAKDFCENKLKNQIEVIVLDNGSEDGSAQMIKDQFGWVKLIVSKENLGFSKGNNLAVGKSKYPFILLLNSDVYVSENSLYKALAYFRVNLNCDVLGARLTYFDGRLQPSAGDEPTPLNIISWIFGISGFHQKKKSYFSKAHSVGWVMGAFFMLKRKVWEKTNGFDQNIFMYLEEVELSKRVRDLGFKIWYVPEVEAVHLHGASSNFDLSSGFLSEIKGIRYYLRKHYKNSYLIIKIFLALGLILRIIAFSILGKTKRARVYMEGLGII